MNYKFLINTITDWDDPPRARHQIAEALCADHEVVFVSANRVAEFDVGIVPYSLTSKIDRTPNKLWLYLSLGRPVVISNIKSIEHWEFKDGFVYRANNYDEFYNLIKRAFHENTPELAEERISLASENTWAKRTDEFIRILQKSFPEETQQEGYLS